MYSKTEAFSQSNNLKSSTQPKSSSYFKKDNDDDNDDELLKNCNFTLLEAKGNQKTNTSLNAEKTSAKRQSQENSKYSPFKKIKTESSDISLADNEAKIQKSYNNSTSENKSNHSKTTFNSKSNIQRIDTKKKTNPEDEDKLLENFDFSQFEKISSNIQSQKKQENNASMTTPNGKETSFLKDSNVEPSQEFNKKQSQVETKKINHETCCLRNKPSNIQADQNNFSLCTHKINGFIIEFTSKLMQSKLKWSQECLISDMLSNSYDVYLGNETIETLLELTCLEAKDMFKKTKEINLPPSQNEYFIFFENKKSMYFAKVAKSKFLMHLKYDLSKRMFCVLKIEDIQDR